MFIALITAAISPATGEALVMAFTFRPHIIDTTLPGGSYAQTDVADIDGDGRPEFIVGRQGGEWREHTILDTNLGGHEAVVADFTGNGLPDIISKPWSARPGNAVGGKLFVVFLENISGLREE